MWYHLKLTDTCSQELHWTVHSYLPGWSTKPHTHSINCATAPKPSSSRELPLLEMPLGPWAAAAGHPILLPSSTAALQPHQPIDLGQSHCAPSPHRDLCKPLLVETSPTSYQPTPCPKCPSPPAQRGQWPLLGALSRLSPTQPPSSPHSSPHATHVDPPPPLPAHLLLASSITFAS